MPSLRKDPFGPAWVLISPERGMLPSDFGSAPAPGDVVATSPLVPGREAELPPEIQALRSSGSQVGGPAWRARVVAHPRSPFEPRPFVLGGDGVHRSATASGWHELVIEHRDPHERLETFSSDHLVDVWRLYRDRVAHHAGRPEVRHVHVSRNVGHAAGAQYQHPHGQVLALPVVDRWVEEERAAMSAHHRGTGRCLLCDVVAQELAERERIVSMNDGFVAFAPFASKQPFEVWIAPRSHHSAFQQTATNRLADLGDALQTVIRAWNAALQRPPYHLVIHTVPAAGEADFHWHLKLLPRLTGQSGYDWSLGSFVNPTPPEAAARFLRETAAGIDAGVIDGAAERASAWT
jgi:UDPglucose--hexose-1-phosphate uridylyltransferase